MKNTFGNNLTITLFGESHGKYVGSTIDGIMPGIEINEEFIASQLSLRRPEGTYSTSRVEEDKYEIISGVFNGYTTGSPVTIIIPNSDVRSGDYLPRLARPSHADYAANVKYHGYEDYRGGGHFSGRLTSAVVAVAAVLIHEMRKHGIYISTHIKHINGIYDRDFDCKNLADDINFLSEKKFAVLDDEKGEMMKKRILEVKEQGDSVGGVLETIITGLPAGLGEPYFDSVESLIAHGLFSVPAVKGVEFGDGFGLSLMTGSESNDEMINEDGRIKHLSLHSGGIYGGITVGEPIIVRTAIKPTPTIGLPQNTITLPEHKNTTLPAKGRHDACIVPRARVVVDSIIAITLADIITGRYGTDRR